MIALLSKQACARCPLSLRCLQGKPITGSRYTHRTTIRQLAYCPRCGTVTFTVGSMRYVCGQYKYKVVNSKSHFKSPTGRVIWGYTLSGIPLITNGCATVTALPRPDSCLRLFDFEEEW